MNKYIIGILILVILGMVFLFYETADCVIHRAQSGIMVDWPLIKDCAY